MTVRRSRIASIVVGSLALTGLTLVLSPSAQAATCNINGTLRPCTLTYWYPTSGVTCVEEAWTPAYGGYAYRGRCYGTPVGTSRGYKYREGIKCAAFSTWVYGPWENNGSWSQPNNCPANAPATYHGVNFAWV